MAPAPEDRYQSADEVAAALAAFVPPGADPRRELADLLGLCFNVTLQKQLLADDIAAAKQFLHDRNAEPTSVSKPDRTLPLPGLETPTAIEPGTPTVRTARPVAATVPVPIQTAAKRGSSAGPWLAAGVAAIVATSGIGLLRTHGRTARSRASAASVAVAQTPVGPTVSAPPAPTAERPVAPVAPTLPEPVVATAARPAVLTARVPPTDNPRRVAGRLLRRANDLWERGNSPGAYALARQAVAAGAGAPAHVLLGALLINMKNYAAAEPELATAARLDPRNAEARRMLALLDRTAAEHQGN
jgi:hypothetical protein